ncbi:MAG: GAF domain-containing protein [Chloroflexi bacterium]|nr:GAF domain-containing protein [Chloroflexota bacterium]
MTWLSLSRLAAWRATAYRRTALDTAAPSNGPIGAEAPALAEVDAAGPCAVRGGLPPPNDADPVPSDSEARGISRGGRSRLATMRLGRPILAARYGLPVVVSALALLLALALGPWVEGSPFSLFLATVMLSAWYGGLGPGLLATILGGLISATFFLPPFATPEVATATSAARLVVFTLVALVISSLSASLRKARRRAEAATEELRALQAITDTTLAHLGLSDLLEELLVRIRRALAADAGRILLLSEDGRELVLRASIGADHESGDVRIPLGTGIAGRVARQREPLMVDDVLRDEGADYPLLARGVRSLVAAPMIVEGRLIGVIGVGTAGYHRFSRADSRLLQLVADRLAVAIDRARLFVAEQQARAEAKYTEVLRARAGQQAGVAALGQLALTGQPLDELMEHAVRMVTATLGVEFAKVLELRPDEGILVLRAGAGWPEDAPESTPLETGSNTQAGYTLRTGGPVVVDDLRTETRFTGPSLLHRFGVVSGMSVIIHGRGHTFGVLGAHTTRHRTFTEDDVNFLQATANVLATVVERRRAEEERAQLIREQAARAEAEAAQARLAFLAEASSALAASLDYETTLNAVAHLAVPTLADFCTVDVVEADGRVQRVATAHADPSRESLVRQLGAFPPDTLATEGIGKALRTGEPEVVQQMSASFLGASTSDERPLAITRALEGRAAMIVPLVARGRTLGAIGLFLAESERQYDDADLALARELAARAALAVDNARLYGEAQHAIRVRDEFLASASHELRTPLSHIKGFVSTLRQTDVEWDDETREDFLAEVEREADRLAKLIGDLLDMTRLESGGLEGGDRVLLRPAAVVDGGLDRVRGLLGSHPVRLEVPDDLPMVLADASQLERVVANLVENAAKYSPTGAEIRVNGTTEDGVVELRVEDAGTGIPPEYLDQVFEKFFRLRRQGAPIAGTGLGLAICRRIVEGHGGRIRAENRPEGGARFVVQLPVADSTKGVAA